MEQIKNSSNDEGVFKVNNYLNDNSGTPIFFAIFGMNDDRAEKLNEDRYEVFVDGHYIGDKVLYTQHEDESTVADFLKNQGFSDVRVEKDGDHIIVHSHNREEAMEMNRALEVYLNNR